MTKGFFDQYDRFYTTSKTSPWPNRLNSRYLAAIAPHQEILRGKIILDIASHDGRWSFAALASGAHHVTGVEPRSHLVKASTENMRHYAVDTSRYTFYQDDIFDFLKRNDFECETVLLFGYLYHTDRHSDLANLIAKTKAKNIILDTAILPRILNPHSMPIVQLVSEPTELEWNAIGNSSYSIVGYPSREAIELVFRPHGFSMKETIWQSVTDNTDGVLDYFNDTRSTFLLSRP